MRYQRYELYMEPVDVLEMDIEYTFERSENLYDFAREVLKMDKFPEERMYEISVNAKGEVIGFYEVSRGGISESVASPREIFKKALFHNAAAIFLLHNHPSGNPTPSEADIKVTRKIVDAGNLMDVNVVDHVIVGDNQFTSLKAEGLMNTTLSPL